ncbi:hypothetical protein [Grimontia marina]|uniref:hypothetical protein n=1 Tax=Grimontia marina TaxID=646534 RepID=UPI000A9AD1EF|nr:hypothetical protein [Grimontia marina]
MMPLWRLEPYAVKVARTVLRETALGNKCRPPDRNVPEQIALTRVGQRYNAFYCLGAA